MYLRKQPISTLGTIPNVYSTGEKSSSDISGRIFLSQFLKEMSLENYLEINDYSNVLFDRISIAKKV